MQRRVISVLLSVAFVCALPFTVFSQSPQRERPKLKNFGDSLKRLNWDPAAKSTVDERRTTSNKSESGLDVIRVETDLVVSTFLVVDQQGRTVTGLSQTDFIITENDEVQDVSVFALGDSQNVPRSIVLIIDYSGSQFPYIKNSVAAAKLLVDKLGPLDLMAIVTDDVELLLDFTSDKKKLKDKLDTLVKKSYSKPSFWFSSSKFGRSKQYSALMATLKEAFIDEDVRPIVIFQTDGDEIGSLRNSNPADYFPFVQPPPLKLTEREKEIIKKIQIQMPASAEFSIDDLYRTAEESRATIYTVIPGFKFLDLSDSELKEQWMKSHAASSAMWAARSSHPERTQTAAAQRLMETPEDLIMARAVGACRMQEALAKVSPLTGGLTAFLESPDQAEAIYSRILADINQRYVVGYYPKNKERDGKRRRVKIEVRGHPEYGVVGRKAYYAPLAN